MNRPPPPKPEDLAPRKRPAGPAPAVTPASRPADPGAASAARQAAAVSPGNTPPPKPTTLSAPSSERLVPIEDQPRPPRRKLRKFGKFVAVLVLAGVVWTAWAAAAFYDLRNGLENSDAVALERRIDWLRVRDGLRDDLLAGRATGGNPLDTGRADPMLSHSAIANLLRTATLDEHGWDATPAEPAKPEVFGWYRVRSALFSGGPFAFRVEISPASDRFKRPFVLLLQWSGDWRLTRVFLPGDAAGPATAAQTTKATTKSASAASISSARPPPAGAQRAILYEEDPTNPNGRSATGWVNWRTEQAAGGGAETAIVAEVSVPERPLGLRMTIRRNLDKALPASHTIELKFNVPRDQPTRGILDLAAIQMKPSEDGAGQQLAGSRVKVSDGFFLWDCRRSSSTCRATWKCSRTGHGSASCSSIRTTHAQCLPSKKAKPAARSSPMCWRSGAPVPSRPATARDSATAIPARRLSRAGWRVDILPHRLRAPSHKCRAC
jgi:hypothetical protein